MLPQKEIQDTYIPTRLEQFQRFQKMVAARGGGTKQLDPPPPPLNFNSF